MALSFFPGTKTTRRTRFRARQAGPIPRHGFCFVCEARLMPEVFVSLDALYWCASIFLWSLFTGLGVPPLPEEAGILYAASVATLHPASTGGWHGRPLPWE